MEYFEEIAQGPQYSIPTPWWKRYVNDIISVVTKKQVDTLFHHLNSVDPHIKFIIEAPSNDGSILFLDTKCSPNSDDTIHTSVYRKQTHTDCYLHWNSNHQIVDKKAVIHVLFYRAKMFLLLLKSWLKKWTTSIDFFLKATKKTR